MPSEGFTLTPLDYRSTMKLTTTESEIGIYRKNGCCGGRSSLEKVLLFVVILTLAAAIAACIAIAVVAQKAEEAEESTVAATHAPTTPAVVEDDSICVTPGCVAAAARVNEYIDTSVHPCDNFFKYSCGNWIKKHPIPEDRSSIDTFGVLRDEVEVILKDLLERPADEKDINATLKAKRLYDSCINVSLIEERHHAPLDFLYSTTGPWPLLNSSTWDNSSFDLIQLLINATRHAYRPLIEIYASTDAKNSSARIIYLDQPSLIMPGRDYYNESVYDTALPALRTYILGLAEALGAQGVDKAVEELVIFEQQVAQATVPSEDRRDSTKLYNRMTVADLATNVSAKFDWPRYIKGVLEIGGIAVGHDEPVVVRSPSYLTRLMDILEQAPNETIANYIITYILVDLAKALPANIRDLETDYQKAVFGTQAARARWRTCVAITRDVLGDAVGRMFVDEVFDESAKDIALEMISSIRKAFNGLLEDIDWMDNPTRKVAEEKAEAIGENIGYSDDDVKNNTVLEATYTNVDYLSTELFENTLKAGEWASVESFKRLRVPVRKDEWGISPAVVNAYYSSTKNHITFPAAILQPPFFSKNYPKSMNYGGIGLVIGHEITHGFDDQGRQYDKNGDLKEWWSDDVIRKFKEKAQCIVDQYSDYLVPEANMKLNGVNTQGENIADNGGLRQSFTAYRDWVRNQGKEEPKLPGVDLNHSQLFFVNFAQIWCSTMRRENAINRILTGVHSPGRFRVIGSLHNSIEFSEVFNCPQSSYMNADKKCRVW
ncbi:neprilysin-like [Liolophura sinensis]|uniref:neprilysin-like n=1 Tax=Liolophura sinensis TaxID=3198878 RepID=UPI0031587E09